MFIVYGRVFCVSPLQIAIADTDAMAAIEICMKQEEMAAIEICMKQEEMSLFF